MKIALFSDIHTEFWSNSDASHLELMMAPAKTCDVVVLAGDIASGRTNVKAILRKFAERYAHVIYVPGNHEYYGSNIETFNDFGEVKQNNVYILNPGVKHISDREGDLVAFIGAPLWTNFGHDEHAKLAASTMITDFRLIKGFKPDDAATLYGDHIEHIKHYYECIPGKKVVVTHFLPANVCTHPRFQGENLLNKYFANSLDGWISDLSDTTWMFGHTHDSMDLVIGDTRLVCNPFGYAPNDLNPQFKHNMIVEV